MPILADHKTNELITASEHEVLGGLLTLLRAQTQWVPDLMGLLATYAEHVKRGVPLTPEMLLRDVMNSFTTDGTNPKSLEGVLMVVGRNRGYDEIDNDEFKELANYLRALRAGGWLAERMSLELDFFAEGRRYTPGEVIQHFTSSLSNFEGSVSVAKDLVRDYPHLFEDDLKALSAAVANADPVEPAAAGAGPEPSTPQPAAPQRRPRKRTSGKAALAASK